MLHFLILFSDVQESWNHMRQLNTYKSFRKDFKKQDDLYIYIYI